MYKGEYAAFFCEKCECCIYLDIILTLILSDEFKSNMSEKNVDYIKKVLTESLPPTKDQSYNFSHKDPDRRPMEIKLLKDFIELEEKV